MRSSDVITRSNRASTMGLDVIDSQHQHHPHCSRVPTTLCWPEPIHLRSDHKGQFYQKLACCITYIVSQKVATMGSSGIPVIIVILNTKCTTVMFEWFNSSHHMLLECWETQLDTYTVQYLFPCDLLLSVQPVMESILAREGCPWNPNLSDREMSISAWLSIPLTARIGSLAFCRSKWAKRYLEWWRAVPSVLPWILLWSPSV